MELENIVANTVYLKAREGGPEGSKGRRYKPTDNISKTVFLYSNSMLVLLMTNFTTRNFNKLIMYVLLERVKKYLEFESISGFWLSLSIFHSYNLMDFLWKTKIFYFLSKSLHFLASDFYCSTKIVFLLFVFYIDMQSSFFLEKIQSRLFFISPLFDIVHNLVILQQKMEEAFNISSHIWVQGPGYNSQGG